MKLHPSILTLLAMGWVVFLAAPDLANAQGAMLLQKPVTPGHCGEFTAPNLMKDSGVVCDNKNVMIYDPAAGAAGMTLQGNYLGNGGPAIVLNQPGKSLTISKTFAGGAAASDGSDVLVQRSANYTGGVSGFVNSALEAYSTVAPGTTAYEWALIGRMDNNGTAGDASQNVGGYFQGRKQSTGATWGSVSELYDNTANPVSSSVTQELDLRAIGPDNIGAGGRVISDLFLTSQDGNPTVARYGLRLNTDAHSKITHPLYFNGTFAEGINLAHGTYDGSNAFILGDTNHLCVDTNCFAYLFHSAGVLYYGTSSGNVASISDTGQVAGTTLVSGGNVLIATGNHYCLDVSCGAYVYETAGVIALNIGGVDQMTVDSSGNIKARGGYQTFLNTGANCAGVSAATVVVDHGIVVHC